MASSSSSLLSSLVLVLLVSVCLSQLFAEAMKIPGFKSKMTKEEEEEAERLKLAKVAYKQLFVRSGAKLTNDEIFEKLQQLDHYYGNEDYDMPYDFRLLMRYNQTEEVNCDDREYVEGLKRLVKRTTKEFKALHGYVEECFQRQLQVCDYENRFKAIVERFQREEATKWQLIQDFNYKVAQNGVRLYDWKGKYIDNSWQMNEALKDLFAWKTETGQWTNYDASMKLYTVARELIESCKLFEQRVGTSLTMTTLNPKIKQNQEILEWLRYLNVCGQVDRVNFERAIGEMFSKYHLPAEINNMWDSYLGYRDAWNL